MILDKIKKTKKDLQEWLKTPNGKRTRRAMPAVLLTALVFSIVILTIFHATDGFTTIVETEYTNLVTEKNTMTFVGYTLSDAETVTSVYSGGVYYLAGNGSRVKPGDALAKVYEEISNENDKKTADRLDRLISILEESIGDGHFTLGESKDVQNGISKIYYEMMHGISNGETSLVSASADELLILLNKMDSYVSGDVSELQALLDGYKAEKNKLESYYKGNYQTVNSEYGGYFFKTIDGYESIYSSRNIDELTYESFLDMTKSEKSNTVGIGKILLNYKWYIAIPTVSGISDAFSIGGEYEVTFPDDGNRTLSMILENVLYDATNSQTVMLFSSGMIDPDFNYLRMQQVNIVSKNITGYRVPETAICELGGSKGVYILKDGRASFRKITVLYHGDGYYIVSADNTNSDGYYVYLELNDRIITDSKNMHDGKVIE